VLFIRDGPSGLSRAGRSWLAIARSAWGRDVLQQRSFVWLVASRLFFLAGTGAIIRFALPYLERAMGMGQQQAGGFINIALIAVVVPTALTVLPSARLSDRVGRKPVIYGACALGAGGLAVAALSPTIDIALVALAIVGVGAGAFLAVDWALMTDIIPKATTGRFMGISNVGTAMAGPVAALLGGLTMDVVARTDLAASPRAAYLVGVLFFVIAAILLRPVDPTRRDGDVGPRHANGRRMLGLTPWSESSASVATRVFRRSDKSLSPPTWWLKHGWLQGMSSGSNARATASCSFHRTGWPRGGGEPSRVVLDRLPAHIRPAT